MKYTVLRADPAGNVTLFVLSSVEKEKRSALAARLMADKRFGAEQVAFIGAVQGDADAHMEMMGGEFCGNATRACGMMAAKQQGLRGKCRVRIETSGCDHPVGVDVDMDEQTSRAEMPLPRLVRSETVDGVRGTLVHLGGIAHFVVEGVTPDEAFFSKAEEMFRSLEGLDAYGVIFLTGGEGQMTPLVKVPATDTLVWEGSCGSGSLAAAIAQSEGTADGEFVREYRQPAGTVCAGVVRKNGSITQAYIGGAVLLDTPEEIEI